MRGRVRKARATSAEQTVRGSQIPTAVVRDAEQGRIAIRNVRRDALSDIKELLKERLITEDEDHRAHDDVQKITDQYVAHVDELLKEKEEEIMSF